MIPSAFRRFVRGNRRRAIEAHARLATVGAADLTPDILERSHLSVAGWRGLLAMLHDDVIELHRAAYEYAGRPSMEEFRGLPERQ